MDKMFGYSFYGVAGNLSISYDDFRNVCGAGSNDSKDDSVSIGVLRFVGF
jgi:hypothetical protein